jgi:hypothetical protein
MIYEMCSKFADEELVPHAGEWDKKHEYPKNAIAQLVSTGTGLPDIQSCAFFPCAVRILCFMYSHHCFSNSSCIKPTV